MEKPQNNGNSKDNDKDAGLALILILIIIAITTDSKNFFIPIIVILIIIMTIPILLRPFSIVWFSLSSALGRYSSAIILTFLYVILVIPISFFKRILDSEYDPLQRKLWKKEDVSAFAKQEHKYKATDMQNPF